MITDHLNEEFLTKREEEILKVGFIDFRNQNPNLDCMKHLIALNSIKGLVTIRSDWDYLIVKFSEELTYPFTEAVYGIRPENILWEEYCTKSIIGIETLIDNVVIINGANIVQDLANFLVD